MSFVIVRRTKNFATCSKAQAHERTGEDQMTTINMGRETIRNSGFKASPGLMGQIKTYLARSHAEKQLRQLDDRLLSDIGLKRADIGKSIWGR
jgi:uncharacterized protein YjiS (DUF1127 family)